MDLSSSLSFDCTTSKGNKCPNCGVYLKETNLPEYCLFCNNIKGELENLESRVYYKQTSIWDHWSCFCDPIEEEGSPTKIQKIETIRQFDEEYDDDYADEWYNVQVKKAKSEKYVLKRYMEGQLEMKTYHRSATVCWMHALVKTSFTRVSDETFFLAVNLLDRILNVFSLSLHQIQYFALVALSVATKFEEIYCIGIDDMVQHLDDNKCSKRYLKDIERVMLCKLKYDICTPTIICFLSRFTKSVIPYITEPNKKKFSDFVIHLGKISLFDYEFTVSYNTQIQALACVSVALYTFGGSPIVKHNQKLMDSALISEDEKPIFYRCANDLFKVFKTFTCTPEEYNSQGLDLRLDMICSDLNPKTDPPFDTHTTLPESPQPKRDAYGINKGCSEGAISPSSALVKFSTLTIKSPPPRQHLILTCNETLDDED